MFAKIIVLVVLLVGVNCRYILLTEDEAPYLTGFVPVTDRIRAKRDDNNGNSLSLSEREIPKFGKQQTLAGTMNLVDTDKHQLNANAFVSRNLPTKSEIPIFHTVGGGADYMFDKKVGASIDVAHTPLFQKTDVNAMGKLNLYNDKTSSLDFGAGASRSFSPYIPKSSWEPNFKFSWTKSF